MITRDMFKQEELKTIEYIPFSLLTDDLYREISRGSKVSVIEDRGILVEKSIRGIL